MLDVDLEVQGRLRRGVVVLEVAHAHAVEVEDFRLDEALVAVQPHDPSQEGVEVVLVPVLNGRHMEVFSEDLAIAPQQVKRVNPRASHREVVMGEVHLPRCVVIEEVPQREDER